jgi:hypothetical protein
MKKIGLIALIVVLALGIIGVGYAAWSQTLTATGTVNSGTFKADFTTAVTDDLGTAYGTGVVDPKIAGTYNGTTWSVATSSTQDVGWTTAPQISSSIVSGPVDTLAVTINNAYPGYYSTTYFVIKNNGSVPLNLTVPATGAGSLTVTTTSTGAASNNVKATLLDASSGSLGTAIVVAPNATTYGYLTIGVGTEAGAGTEPPVTGAAYTVTFTVTANQNTN